MKFVDEFRDRHACERLRDAIARETSRPWTIMEVCGGQTHAIVKYGLDAFLPETFSFIHGPGCPVCVTSAERIDQAIAIASRPETILCAFGDMMRVPGSKGDLLGARATAGADVRVVYSPLDAVDIARKNPEREIVFFAVGFETTAPATALALLQARAAGIANFSLLVAHVLVPPAIEAILADADCRVDGFLAAGHVCAITGLEPYEMLAAKYNKPFVAAGFEPADILQGALLCVRQLESGRAEAENAYPRAVARRGNPQAIEMTRQVFRVVDTHWRGLGLIPSSGLALNASFAQCDALEKFSIEPIDAASSESSECMAGQVLRGHVKPDACPAFATRCLPERPLGAPMVSTEGACAAYYRYRNLPAIDKSRE